MSTSTLVFTYGSMMNETELRCRCPNARLAFVGMLPDRELCFPRHSAKRAGGVAGLKHRIGAVAWGVVWSISDQEIRTLDLAEGYRPNRDSSINCYNRRTATVSREGDTLQPVLVDFYDATPSSIRTPPSVAYLRLILDGAKQNRLPPTYISWLEALL